MSPEPLIDETTVSSVVHEPYKCCASRNDGMYGRLCGGWMGWAATVDGYLRFVCSACKREAFEPVDEAT